MPIAPFIPAIAQGAGALFGGMMAKKSQANAMKRSPEEQQALQGAQGAAGTLGQQGSALFNQGMPQLQQAGGYFSTLLGGNRAQMAQATAAPRAAITDIYRGAERGLEHAGVRGGARDVALSDLNRQRASQIAGLTTGVQPQAAAALGDMGGGQVSAGTSATGSAGSLFGGLLGKGQENRVYARQEGADAGKGWGSVIFDLLSGIKMPSGGKGYIQSDINKVARSGDLSHNGPNWPLVMN